MSEPLILSRLLQFAAVIVVFGCGAFRIYALNVVGCSTGRSAGLAPLRILST